MAVREIKTTLAVDGEKAFNKAVTEAGRNMRVMASEMKAAAADFNLTGDEMDYLSRKSKSLEGQIEQQENIIRALEQAVAESAKAYGDASAKTDGYRIKLNNAQASMAKLKKELEESNREMTELGRDSGRVGRQLETGIGEAAEDVGKKVDTMVTSLDKDLSGIGGAIKFTAAVEGLNAIADAVGGAYQGLTGLVDESMEYSRMMSFLQTNAEAAGHSFETIKNYAIAITGITGDMDAAVEGLSNLLAAGLEADEMALAVNRLSAAVIRFPETLKFEEMASSLQESIMSGQAIGQYAEYLEKVGIDLDVVNKSLKEAAKSKQGIEAVETAALSWLSDAKSEAAFEKWQKDNADMAEYFKAQALLTDAQANLAKELTPIATAAVEGATALFDTATEAAKEAKELWEKWKKIQDEGGLFKESEKVTEGREENLPTWDDFAPGYDTGAEKEGKTDGEEFIGGVKKGIIDSAPQLPTWDDFAPGYDFGTEETGKEIAKGIGDGIEEESESAINKAKRLWASIAAELSKTIAGPTVGAPQTGTSRTGTSTNTDGSMNVSIGMDGKIFGKVSAPYTSAQLGALADRYETYG